MFTQSVAACGGSVIHAVFDHKYSNRSSDWGYSSFIKWKVSDKYVQWNRRRLDTRDSN